MEKALAELYSSNPENKRQFHPGNTPINQLRSLKCQNRVVEHSDLVRKILCEHGTLAKAARFYRTTYKTFRYLCAPPRKDISKRKVKHNNKKKELSTFFKQEGISYELPSSRQGGKHFLFKTLAETYSNYEKECLDDGKVPIPYTTFAKLRPKNVFTVGKTPERECVCEVCENARLLKHSLGKCKLEGIPNTLAQCISMMLCSVTDDETDVGFQAQGDIGYMKCLKRECSECGTNKLRTTIEGRNSDLSANCNWERWQWQKRGNSRRLELVSLRTTKLAMLKQFYKDIGDLALHLFNAHWHYSQFKFVKNNLLPGQLLQVLDFGQNYMNRYQDEPQSVHWDHNQTVLHPIINYYLDPKTNKFTTNEHMMITDDLQHDKFAVRTFEKLSMKQLETDGFVPKQIIQFCDNCAGQYKSKGPFQYLSFSDIPTQRNYFGSRHGKGPADGAVGRAKQLATRAKKSRRVIIRNAFDFYTHLDAESRKHASKRQETDRVFKQKFFWVPNIERNNDIVAVTTKKTRKFYSIRSTGCRMVIEARNVACLCPSCLTNDGSDCPNKEYAQEWKAYDLRTGKPVMDDKFENLHWPINLGIQDACDNETDFSFNETDFSFNESDVSHPEEFSWHRIFERVQNCDTYSSLEEIIETFDRSEITPITREVITSARGFRIDLVAQECMPAEVKGLYIPLKTYGDGNCYPRSVSKAVYATEDNHVEIRMRLLIEGVTNRDIYLSNEYLAIGARQFHSRADLPLVFAAYSGQYVPDYSADRRDEIVQEVYQNEMLALKNLGVYMGMWQIAQTTNILNRPVTSVFPERGSAAFRNDFNRTMYPWREEFRALPSLMIMWTPMTKNGVINHFVPLIRN